MAEVLGEINAKKRLLERETAVQTDARMDGSEGKAATTSTGTNTDSHDVQGGVFQTLMEGKEFSYLNPFAVSALNLHTINSAQTTLIQSLRHQNEVLQDTLRRSEARMGESCKNCNGDDIKPLRQVVLEVLRDVLQEVRGDFTPKRRTRISAPRTEVEDMDIFVDAPEVGKKRGPTEDEQEVVPDSKRQKTDEGDGEERKKNPMEAPPPADTEESKGKADSPKDKDTNATKEKPDDNDGKKDTTEKMQGNGKKDVPEEKDNNPVKKDADSDVELSAEALADLGKPAKKKVTITLHLPTPKPLKDLRGSDEDAIASLAALGSEKEKLIKAAEIFMDMKRESGEAAELLKKLKGLGRTVLGAPNRIPNPNSFFAAIVKECPEAAVDGPKLRLLLIDFMTTYSSRFIKVTKLSLTSYFSLQVLDVSFLLCINKCCLLLIAGNVFN